MSSTVTLPLWLFLLILLFAATTFASNFLFPSVRWYFRRRLERAVSRLNLKLKRPIQPFKLAARQDTVRQLLFDPEIAAAIHDHARTQNIRVDVAAQNAERYAREIVPGFSAFAYFSFGARIARWFSKSLYRVRLDNPQDLKLEQIPADSTLIFVMNHRSNMDYVLVTWLVAEQSALAYAVGEWARVWPLRPLVRAMGGYFIRRRHNNPLYRKVLARYVQLATEGGLTQAIFPEGGLSRTGGLGAPKLGLLSYLIDGFAPEGERDIVFVPVALNYDRVMEDRNLLAAQSGQRGFRFSLVPIYGYLRRQIWLRLTGRTWHYGYAAARFGTPISLRDFLSRKPEDQAEALGARLMAAIADAMPVLPVPLIARCLVSGAKDRSALRRKLQEQLAFLETKGRAPIEWDESLDGIVDLGLTAFSERGLIAITSGQIEITAHGEDIVNYYAASIEHLFGDLDPPALAQKGPCTNSTDHM